MSNKTYCIYCHTNKINGMKYVGQTSQNPIFRWGLDGNGYQNNNEFYEDILEYGWGNFTHEILEYGIQTKQRADKLEGKYIDRYNSIYPNGYNKMDVSAAIANKNRPKRPKEGWHHSEETKEKIRQGNKLAETNPLSARIKRSKPVVMCSVDGEILDTFYGASEASRQTGVDISTICKACKDTTGRYQTAGGYIWQYAI